MAFLKRELEGNRNGPREPRARERIRRALWKRGFAGALLVSVAGCGGPQQRTVTLRNQSGETIGTATLTEKGTSTETVIKLVPGHDPAILQAHIHRDPCALRNDVLYVLNAFESGISTTVLPIELSELGLVEHAVDAHRSDMLNTYAGCGNME